MKTLIELAVNSFLLTLIFMFSGNLLFSQDWWIVLIFLVLFGVFNHVIGYLEGLNQK